MANVLTLRNLRKITGSYEINNAAAYVTITTAQNEVQIIDFEDILAICNNTVFYYANSALNEVASIEEDNGMRKYTLVDGTVVIPFMRSAVGTTFIKNAQPEIVEEQQETEVEAESDDVEAEEDEIEEAAPVAKAVSGRRGRKPKAEPVVEESVASEEVEEDEDDELELDDEDDEVVEESVDDSEDLDENADDEEDEDDELELDEDEEDEEEELPVKKPTRNTKSAPVEEDDEDEDDELELDDEDDSDDFDFEEESDDSEEDDVEADEPDDEDNELEFDESDEEDKDEIVEDDDDDDFDI